MDLEPPFDQIVKARREGKSDGDIIQIAGIDAYRTSLAAASSVPEDLDVGEYLQLLKRISSDTRIGAQLKRYGERMLRGDTVDHSDILDTVSRLETSSYEWVRMGEVTEEAAIWKPTYWEAWDEYIGGVPKYGLMLIPGAPGTGKSTAVVKLIDTMTHHQKEVGMLSLEMTKEVVKMRWLQIHPTLSKRQADRLFVTDLSYSLDDACAAITRLIGQNPNIYAVFIDFADLMVVLESTEAASQIYVKLAALAKKLQIPIFLLCQLSRGYTGGVPHVTDIRWSGLAEAMASLIILVYNPDQIFADMGKDNKENPLSNMGEGYATLIEGKSRFGYKMGGTGAVQIEWAKAQGWGDEGFRWIPL